MHHESKYSGESEYQYGIHAGAVRSGSKVIELSMSKRTFGVKDSQGRFPGTTATGLDTASLEACVSYASQSTMVLPLSQPG